MNRSHFLARFGGWIGALATGLFLPRKVSAQQAPDAPCEEELKKIRGEKTFVDNWLSDLLDAMETKLDEKTRIDLISSCGRACYNRHSFKQEMARKGKGDLDRLMQAYQENHFESWREGETVHVRIGGTVKKCYCPVARNRPFSPDNPHCECTRMTHQTIFEEALGRPVPVDIIESLRRGGNCCHFLAHL